VGHWTQALGRVLQAGVGSMWDSQANTGEKEGKASANEALAAALRADPKDPQAAIAPLSHNPWTQEMGQGLTQNLIASRFAAPKKTDDEREYETAKGQGYKGTLLDYQKELKTAGATVVNNNVGERKLDSVRAEGLGKRFNTIAEDGIKADEDATMLSRITQLNSAVDPGTRTALFEAIRAQTGIALDPNADNVQAFKKAASYLVPRMRVPGSGASSDRDMAMFEKALPDLLATPGGNEIAIQTLGGLVQQRKARAEIAEAWQREEIDSKEADARMKALPDPFEAFKKANPTTRKPVSTSPTLEPGTVMAGYRFKGGDPSKRENWEKAQ
jgi:hypothetical protein